MTIHNLNLTQPLAILSLVAIEDRVPDTPDPIKTTGMALQEAMLFYFLLRGRLGFSAGSSEVIC